MLKRLLASNRPLIRLLFALVPVALAVLHVIGIAKLGALEWIDNLIYDSRLRATMPRTLDERIAIVDVDEKSLAEVGRWPWPRDKLAILTKELFDRQHIAVLGFDMVFAEPDESSGLTRLRKIAEARLAHIPEFATELELLSAELDNDQLFANAIASHPVVLGHYFTSDRDGRQSGQLPAPVMTKDDMKGAASGFIGWTGYGASLALLAQSATSGGYFNAITDSDGVVRAVPLVSEFGGAYYQSLSLAVFRTLMGNTALKPKFPASRFLPKGYRGIESIVIQQGDKSLSLPVDHRVGSLIPYRGWGGPKGGSFKYVSASDVLSGRMPPDTLKGKIILVGTTAPGLLDLRTTPVGAAYPGVEAHANLLSGFLDGNVIATPDYALGYELAVVIISGGLLVVLLPLLPAARAVALCVLMLSVVTGLNFWLYAIHGLVLPLAAALFMIIASFVMNMSYGYFAESRSKRELAQLFGTYVPPELVDEMVKDPDSYSMQAEARELSVMFCDMRGFTSLAETMSPEELQALLNRVFSRMTEVIRQHRGTIDKYMGDCVMAFWGAPIRSDSHASQAVEAALDMKLALEKINIEFRLQGKPTIGVGIGINTGPMFVGDMGSDIRRSYTVIGDAVNLASRLESLSRTYGVDIVVGENTRRQAAAFYWQELDRVVVKGKEDAVSIFTPMAAQSDAGNMQIQQELVLWGRFLKAFRSQRWDECDLHLLNLQHLRRNSPLYQYYIQRLAQQRLLPIDPAWDGTTRFVVK